MRMAVAWSVAAIVFLILDGIWLGVVARGFYREQIGHLLAADFRIGPAALFYVVYLVGIGYFALAPALASGAWQSALVPAAMLGMIAYATYDLTSWAVMRDWPAAMTFVDIAWGVVITTTAAGVGAFVALRWG